MGSARRHPGWRVEREQNTRYEGMVFLGKRYSEMLPRVEMGAQGEEAGRWVGYSHLLQPGGCQVQRRQKVL